MKSIEAGLRNPHLVAVVVLAVIVVGVTAVTRIPADLLPQFETPAVQIVTFYPGMPPEVMERDIMSRLERWTGQSVGIEHQEAKAMLGVCVVKDFFREDISFDTAMSQVTSYAMSDLFYLPPGTIPPMVMPFDPTASVPLCLVSVSSPTMSEKDLYDVAYFDLRNNLQSIEGVIAPAVYGGVLRRILAYVDRHELEARGLSPMDVVTALKGQNVLVPTGDAKFGDINYQIVSNAMEPEVKSLNDVPIFTKDQAVVFMRDLGEVKDSFQIQSNIVRINAHKPALYIPIYRQPGANTIAIVKGIRSQLATILKRLREMNPEKNKDLSLELVMDQSSYVASSITGLQIAATLGAILAGVVVLIFLRSLRSTLVIVLAIPLSILATFIGLFYTGDTINSMTLGGLALAIGVLVDQSIVVLDNITRHMRMGKTRMQAAADGTREVALPVLVSTITFVVVFFPVVFLKGIPRFLFAPLAVTVTFAVTASYLVAMFVIPAFCGKFLKIKSAVSNQQSAFSGQHSTFSDQHSATEGREGASAGMPRWFHDWFDRVMSHRALVLAGSGGLLVLAILLLTQSGTELFPQVDSNQLTIYVRLPSGTRIENTEATVAQIEQVLMDEIGQPDPEYPKVEAQPDSNMRILISNIGVLMDWPAAYTPNTGPMDAFVLVQLKGKNGMPSTFDYVATLRERLNREFPSVDFAFDTGGMMTAALNFGLPSPINIQVHGSILFTAEEIAGHVQRIAAGVPGAIDVRIAQRMDSPQIDVQVDRVKAAQLGVTQEDVVKNIVTTVNSSINFDPAFWIDEKNGNHYFFGAQYLEEDIESIETLRNIPITGAGSVRPVSLRNIAEFGRKTGPAVVNHLNIQRTIDVYANVEAGYDVGSVAGEMEKRLEASPVLSVKRKESPRGVSYEIGGDYAGKGYSYTMAGEVQTMRASFKQFGGGLLIAVILVYLTMVAQLRSFGVPFVILLTIPMGFIGVGFMLFLTGTNLNIPAAMGVIMMTGIVVEYSIILLEFANQRVRDGLPVLQAIKEATWIRLRPILMTSLTTWLALIPMAIGGRGGEANAPLARTIIGGVLAATALSLIVAPCLYVVFKRETQHEAPAAMTA